MTSVSQTYIRSCGRRWTMLLLPVALTILFLACWPGTCAMECSGIGIQPLDKWMSIGTMHYTTPDYTTNYTHAKCVCNQQLGNTRLAVLDREDVYLVNYKPTYKLRGFLWLDVVRSDVGEYIWGNSCPLLTGNYSRLVYNYSTEPTAEGLIAQADSFAVVLYEVQFNFSAFPLCQSATAPVPVPALSNKNYTMTWVLLGQPPQLLGFSIGQRTREEAASDCRSTGTVLAVLHTLFADVATYLSHQDHKNDVTHWWVAANRTLWKPSSLRMNHSFVWSDGVEVNGQLWAPGHPDLDAVFVRVQLQAGKMNLTGEISANTLSYFICQWIPDEASSVAQKEFPSGCNTSTTTSSLITSELSNSTEKTSSLLKIRSTEATTGQETAATQDGLTTDPDASIAQNSETPLPSGIDKPDYTTKLHTKVEMMQQDQNVTQPNNITMQKDNGVTHTNDVTTQPASNQSSLHSPNTTLWNTTMPLQPTPSETTTQQPIIETSEVTSQQAKPTEPVYGKTILNPVNTEQTTRRRSQQAETTSKDKTTAEEDDIVPNQTGITTNRQIEEDTTGRPNGGYGPLNTPSVSLFDSAETSVTSELTTTFTRTSGTGSTVHTPKSGSCFCTCKAVGSDNISSVDVNERIRKIKEQLTITKHNLSRVVRQRISVDDQRPSAQAVGLTGICFIVLFLLFFPFIDSLSLLKHLFPSKAARDQGVEDRRQVSGGK